MSATQQSAAMSSQRTARYHWGSTQQALTQQGQQTAGPTTDAASHAQLPATDQHAQRLSYASQVQGREGVQHAVSSGLNHQPQPHRKAAYAGQETQPLPPTAAGVSFLGDECAVFPELSHSGMHFLATCSVCYECMKVAILWHVRPTSCVCIA